MSDHPSHTPRGGATPEIQSLAPNIPVHRASALASDHFDFTGDARPLPGDRDQNFLIESPDGAQAVLKVSNAAESADFMACQNAALERLSRARLPHRVPRPLPTRGGDLIAEMEREDGGRHLLRLVTWVPGVLLAEVKPHTPELLEEVGEMFGRVDASLEGWSHPAARRAIDWDLKRGRRVVEERWEWITDPERAALLRGVVDDYEERVAPLADRLRTGVIHGDGNDWNVIVEPPGGPGEPRNVVGLVDFGDLVESWIVAEPAIVATYAMLDKRDPLEAAARVIAGYHRFHALTEDEIGILFPLIRLRLAVSVVMSAYQRAQRPDNDYLSVSETPAWALLEALDPVHPRLAACLFRDACGLVPCPAGAQVTAWLTEHAEAVGPVLDPDPADVESTVLDFGMESPFAAALGGRSDAATWTDVIFAAMEERGATLGIGRYGEIRPWYDGPAYEVPTDRGPERRSLHIGLDLFAPPGTPVLAPLAGTVAAAGVDAGRLGYGPALLLRHEVEGADGAPLVFHTLYGHLDGLSTEGLRAGDAVARGQRIARIGDHPENGDWAPHLHLQIVADDLDAGVGFPGVARPSRRRLWTSLSPDPGLLCPLAGEDDRTTAATADPTEEEILARRRALLAPSLSLSYRRPLHIVRGSMQYLYDTDGQRYLDCVNNVAHVGHCHPHVVDALVRQSAILNTNTRYLNALQVEYAERVAATLPEPLEVCFFVNSGSEANELALRLARTRTGRHDVVVLDGAYHGSTGQLVAMSPYKTKGLGGPEAPSWVHEALLPDPYRGPHRLGESDPQEGDGDEKEVAERYADSVADALDRAAAEGAGAAAFFAESLPGCGGQIVPPDGYLAAAYQYARDAGAACVADEVQTGFGRVGTHFWAFEAQGVVPDIVTLGKPIGNGHPIGAVVTTREIAEAFDTGMEFFSTFGGNHVSCAVGLAVLDVLEEEELQSHASRVGTRLVNQLRDLASRNPLLGDVRGSGLFLGIEIVLDRDERTPAPEHASAVVEAMRERGVLLSADGPDRNVIKFKPPMVFQDEDADRLVRALRDVLLDDRLGVAAE